MKHKHHRKHIRKAFSGVYDSWFWAPPDPEDNAPDEETAWNAINSALHHQRILTGKVLGMANTNSGIATASVDFYGIKVLVPIQYLFLNCTPPQGIPSVPLQSRVQNMKDAIVDFIPIAVDFAGKIVIASRKAAMLAQQRSCFATRNICSGMIVGCRVVSVSGDRVTVEVGGVEQDMQQCSDHSWNAGDVWHLRVLSVTRDRSTRQYSVQLGTIAMGMSSSSPDAA